MNGLTNRQTTVEGARSDQGLDRIDADLVWAARFDAWLPTHAR
jgi:hypothetical protein